jgi:predicted nuclease of predicted toxin-antitoxin system
MRFLADESCDFAVVRSLRAAGHDVIAVASAQPGAADAVVIDLAVRERRVLLTEDRDFGQLVYSTGLPSAGVIYMRFPAQARESLASAVSQYVARAGDQIVDRFVVVQPGRVRVSRRRPQHDES